MTLRVKHIGSALFKCLLALALACMCLGVNTFVPSNAVAESGDGSTCIKLTAKAYPMDQDGNWDTSKGKQTTISKNGGQLRIAVSAVWDNGVVISENEEQDWSDKGAFGGGFTYSWDTSAGYVSVSPTGVVTALKDGTSEITITPQDEEYQNLSAKISITTANQGEGLIVTKVEIVKENGKAYGDDNVRFTELNSSQKLYVRVTYTDKQDDNKKVVYANYPSAPADQTPADGAFDTLSWQVGDTNYCTLTAHNGIATLKGIANATTQVFASITGGDTTVDKGMGKGVVFDTVGVSINNGKTVNNGDPADSLKVKVVYENDPETVIKKATYSVEEFEALGAVTRRYTMTRGKGDYATDEAYGVPIATLLSKLGIDTDDIAYFTLSANDGANPGKISAKWLLKTTRYYFPNYDIGGSLLEKQQVPSMLALADSWSFDTMVTGDLNSGTRFRLVFGSATTNDSATDKSIKFINTFTIVLNGSAPAGEDTEKDDKKVTPGNTEEGEGGGQGTGKGTAKGSGESGGSKTVGDVTQGGGKKVTSTVQTDEDGLLDAKTQWRIYQMMNKSKSDVQAEYEENPLNPYVIPFVVLLLLVAMAARYILFRRESSARKNKIA